MCGIAGVVSSAPREERVIAMLRRLVHRGPDDQGLVSVAGATLGARRLSIIDLERGHQPMGNEDGSVVAVQNGEIYNFGDLREPLERRGHRFATRNDTEVIPHLYEEHGIDFVRRLHGMFAVALWDGSHRRLVLARDRLGKKPLVFARIGSDLIFASEIQALLALRAVPRDVDHDAIAEYLTYGYVPAPRTAFAAIRKVEPGHVLVYEGDDLVTHRYWTPQFEPKTTMPFSEATAELRDRITNAVRMRLIADVPLGVLLSGGLDSSSVVAMMARIGAGRVRTFSIGFGTSDFDELAHARVVAQAYGTDHHEFVVEPNALEILPVLVRHFGEPFADSSAIPTYHVARIAREHVTVALNGDGGDELFGGYPRYRAVALASQLDRLPGVSRGLGAAALLLRGPLLRGRSLSRVRRLLDSLAASPDERYFRWMSYFNGARRAALVRLPDTSRTGPRFLGDAADDFGAVDPVDRAIAADIATYLPGDLLAKMDIATMACSVEGRSPFLDHELIEFAAALPRSYKSSAFETKRILRAAMRGILPESILARRKMGFSVPVGRWLRGPLRWLLDDVVLSDAALGRGYLQPAAVRELARQHLHGGMDHTSLLWALVMLELWFRECVSGPSDLPDSVPVIAATPT